MISQCVPLEDRIMWTLFRGTQKTSLFSSAPLGLTHPSEHGRRGSVNRDFPWDPWLAQPLPGWGKPEHSACGQEMEVFVGVTIMRGGLSGIHQGPRVLDNLQCTRLLNSVKNFPIQPSKVLLDIDVGGKSEWLSEPRPCLHFTYKLKIIIALSY